MTYRHSFLMTQIVATLAGYFKVRQVSPVYPTNDGCVAIVEDETNGVVYRVHMEKIHSQIEAREITPEKIISEGGF